MSSLHNLLRDQFFIRPPDTQVDIATTGQIVGKAIYQNSKAIVYQTEGSVSKPIALEAGVSYNDWRGAGLFMSQPVVDSTPYRVKAYGFGHNTNMWVFCGYGPASPTGINDRIESVTAFPVVQADNGGQFVFDEVIYYPGVSKQDSNYSKPIAFGIGVAVPSSLGTGELGYNLSVQNLAKTAPQFAASMS